MRKTRSLRRLRTTPQAIVARLNFPLNQLVSLTSCRIVSKVNSSASQERWFNRRLTRWSIIRHQKRPTRARRRQAPSDRTLIRHHRHLLATQIDTLRRSFPGGSSLKISRIRCSGSRSSSAPGRRTHSRLILKKIKPVVHLILTELWRIRKVLLLWLLKTF